MRTDPDSLQLWTEANRLASVVEAQIPFRGSDLQRTEDGTLSVTSSDASAEAERLHELLYELEVIHPDNDVDDRFEASPRIDVENIPASDLCQLLNWVSRNDRLDEGLMVVFLNEGVVTRVVKRLCELRFGDA